MRGYREVFRQDERRDPGRIFYTITAADVGKAFIPTEVGAITLADVIGRVLPGDVGKRLYRVPAEAGDSWIWQCENDGQRDARVAKAARLHDELTAIRETTQAGALHPDR